MKNKSLKPGWNWVNFGDVVRQCKDKIDPDNSGLERYVAGDHMDTDDFRLRRWGEIGSGYLGPAFHIHFKPGQVLYGSRRTYLRKVAVADFEGVCANTTFVMESSNSNDLMPELLPFLMQTEAFCAYSIQNSKGSVTPYINFSDLAKFEFALPPISEQSRLVKLLGSVEKSLVSYMDAECSVKLLESSLLEDALVAMSSSPHFPVEQLILNGPRNGLSPKTNADKRGYPTLSIGAVRNGEIITEGYTKYAEISKAEAAAFELKTNDVLVVRGNGNKSLTGKCGLVETVPKGCFFPDLLIRLQFDETKIRPEFAVLQWNSLTMHNLLIARAKTTNGIWKINGADIRKHILKVPRLSEQDSFLDEMRAIRIARKNITTRLKSLNKLKFHALRAIESGGKDGI